MNELQIDVSQSEIAAFVMVKNWLNRKARKERKELKRKTLRSLRPLR